MVDNQGAQPTPLGYFTWSVSIHGDTTANPAFTVTVTAPTWNDGKDANIFFNCQYVP